LKKDIILKDVLKSIVKDIGKYFLNLQIDTLEFIESEFERVENRRADIVAKINDEFILHLEIQNNNHNKMNYRMLRYWLDIREISNLPIKQYVVYIGKDDLNMHSKVIEENIDYGYTLFNIKTIDCELLFREDSPDALVLAVLCDFKDKNPKDVIKYIISRLRHHLEKNSDELRKYFLILEELSTNRNLQESVKEIEMLSDIRYEDLPSYEIGVEAGILKGMQEGIQQAKQTLVFNLLKNGLDEKLIASSAEISEEEIQQIKKQLKGLK
jgi:predicted transposase YdaD